MAKKWNMFKMYTFYYKPAFTWIWQYGDEFKFSYMDFYRYFKLKATIFSPSKTKLPGLCLEFVLFGAGFYFITHYRK